MRPKLWPPADAYLGAGSLPLRGVAGALQVVAQTAARVPYWPQIPIEGEHADMIGEALGPAVAALPPRAQWPVEGDAWLKALSPALRPSEAPGFFAFERAVGEGRFPRAEALKGQLIGPWTLASALGRPDLLEPLTDHRIAQARWQLDRLLAFGLPVLLVVDAPSLPWLPDAHRPEALAALRRLLREIDEHGGIAGLHCCAALALDLLPELRPGVFHFDPSVYGEDIRSGLQAVHAHPGARRWRALGGVLAVGVAPTRGPMPEVNDARRWLAPLQEAGPLLLSTSCGLSGAAPDRVQECAALLAALGAQ